MPESKPAAPDFKDAMEIQMIYAALANEALGSYFADPARLPRIHQAFKTAYESLQVMWTSPATMCDPGEMHAGCKCWPRPIREGSPSA